MRCCDTMLSAPLSTSVKKTYSTRHHNMNVMFNAHTTTQVCCWKDSKIILAAQQNLFFLTPPYYVDKLSDKWIIFATSAYKQHRVQQHRVQQQNRGRKKHSSRLFDCYYCYEQCMLINFNSCCNSLFLSRAPHFLSNYINTWSTQHKFVQIALKCLLVPSSLIVSC